MAYTPTVWKNGEFPPIDAEHLNKIEQGIADAVSVTPQTLSDEQKSKARGNINAAPGGFGLGTRSKWLTDADDLNNIYQGGFYFWYGDKKPANSPKDIYYGGMIVMSRSPTEFVQQVFTITDTSILQNCMLVRTAYNNTWYPWEWVNPPMLLGTEYRTTERYLGKPVYVKAVNFGALPNNTEASVTFGDATTQAFAVTARILKNASSYTLPIPDQAVVWAGGATVYIKTTDDYSAWTGVVTVKYTKTTD